MASRSPLVLGLRTKIDPDVVLGAHGISSTAACRWESAVEGSLETTGSNIPEKNTSLPASKTANLPGFQSFAAKAHLHHGREGSCSFPKARSTAQRAAPVPSQGDQASNLVLKMLCLTASNIGRTLGGLANETECLLAQQRIRDERAHILEVYRPGVPKLAQVRHVRCCASALLKGWNSQCFQSNHLHTRC